jgi:dolichyl-phosphate-mannose--protein O-mannosyl transferase
VTSEPAQEKPAGLWTRIDSVMLGAITLLAAMLRGVGLSRPPGLVFDEFYYGPDACRYVRESADLCGFGELTYFHPPLSKWLISFGIQMFGPTRLGWRSPSVVFGTLTCVVVYLLGRRLLRSTVGASVASGLLAIDFLHLVHSRLAMLDLYMVFFGVLAVLFAVYDWDDERTTFFRPWRLAAGLAGGAAVACKWSGLSLLAVAIVVALLADRSRRGTGEQRRGVSIVSVGIWLVLVPLAFYALTHVGRVDGSLWALPWSEGAWLRNFAFRQADSVAYQTALAEILRGETHPYSSPTWAWILLKRPVAYYFVVLSTGEYEEIMAFGNPLVWWASVPGLLFVAWRWIKGRDRAPGIILGGFLACVMPWFVLARNRPDPYIFYLLPAVPFMCLALGYIAARVWPKRLGRAMSLAYVAVAAALLAFFYPVLTAQPLTPEGWRARMLFRACRYEETQTLGQELRRAGLPIRTTNEGPIPPRAIIPNQTRATGWCWI